MDSFSIFAHSVVSLHQKLILVHRSTYLMLYATQMLFFGLALLIAARPGLDNPGCYRDGWDLFRGICEGMAFSIFLGELFLFIVVLCRYVVASGTYVFYICVAACYMCVCFLNMYVHTSVPQGTEMHFCSAYVYFRSSTSS